MGQPMNIPKDRLSTMYKAAHVMLDGYPLHGHDGFGEIFWIEKGVMEHDINGELQMLAAGDLVFIRPSDSHAFESVQGRKFHLNNVSFHWETYEYLRDRYFPKNRSLYGERGKLPRLFHLSERQMQRISLYFLALFKVRSSRMEIERFLLNVFGELCTLEGHEEEEHRMVPAWLVQARSAIRDPERLRLGVQEFYRLCGRSPEHICREFKLIYEETPSHYIQELRLQYAASLLAGTSREILDIALECGFESLSYFYACFRKSYGMTPHRYRVQNQANMRYL